jgi:hypothetical protein
MQVEADLKNMIAMSVPTEEPVMQTRQASRQGDSELRQRVAAGNLQLATGNSEQPTGGSRNQKRDAIRQAVGTTKVAASRAGFGV